MLMWLDPARFHIALLDALLALDMGSERDVARAVAALDIGRKYQPARPSARHPSHLRTFWEKITRPGAPKTLEGRAATLREKRRKYRDPLSNHWRSVMAGAVMLALYPPDEDAKVRVLAHADAVGEHEFAEAVLFAMIDQRATESLPEFLGQLAIQ